MSQTCQLRKSPTVAAKRKAARRRLFNSKLPSLINSGYDLSIKHTIPAKPKRSIAEVDGSVAAQPKPLTSLRADKDENERRWLVSVVSPRVTSTVLYSNVSLLEHARLSTVDFEGDFPVEDNIVIHGVRRMHSRIFSLKTLS
jgi:hypothetical protein